MLFLESSVASRQDTRICNPADSAATYKLLSRKEWLETLRGRGVDWKDGEPLRTLRPRWLDYVSDPSWLNIEPWIDLANRFSDEALETIGRASPQAARKQLDWLGFGIRGFRLIDDPNLILKIVLEVKETLRIVATQPGPAGIDIVEPTPLSLLTAALSRVDLRRLKQCPVCDKIIYAERKDQTARTGRCSTTRRQRKFRENSPKYNKNRK